MPNPTEERGALVTAAEAVEEELRHVSALGREALRLTLTSGGNLDRTARSLGEFAASEARLASRLNELMVAISTLGAAQHAETSILRARAEELEARRAAYESLVGEFAAVGRRAGDLNRALGAFAEPTRAGIDGPAFIDLRAALAGILEGIEGVLRRALEASFEDVAVQADLLRQQLLLASGRLEALGGARDASAAHVH